MVIRKYLSKVVRKNKRKFLADLGKQGIHRKTAREYLIDLYDAGEIKDEEEDILWIGPDLETLGR